MSISKFFMFNILFLVLIILQGCHNNSDGTAGETKYINVNVFKTKTSEFRESIAYSGTIEESETLPLSFSVLGTVLSVKVSEGDFVKKGQLLAVLNEENFKNAYEISLAARVQAEDAYNRLKPMYENGTLPEIKFIEVETRLQQAKAGTEIAKKNLNDCKLFAPVDGIVGRCTIDPGMNVMPGIATIELVQIEKVFAKVSISENEIASIKRGASAYIKIGALGDKEFKGTIEEIGVVADPLAHTYKTKIGISNKEGIIKPGMICSVNVESQGSVNGVVVPNRAVQVNEKGQSFVYSVNTSKNSISRKYVVTGKLMKNGIEIKNGLEEGELVVVSGQQKLDENSLVRIVN